MVKIEFFVLIEEIPLGMRWEVLEQDSGNIKDGVLNKFLYVAY